MGLSSFSLLPLTISHGPLLFNAAKARMPHYWYYFAPFNFRMHIRSLPSEVLDLTVLESQVQIVYDVESECLGEVNRKINEWIYKANTGAHNLSSC